MARQSVSPGVLGYCFDEARALFWNLADGCEPNGYVAVGGRDALRFVSEICPTIGPHYYVRDNANHLDPTLRYKDPDTGVMTPRTTYPRDSEFAKKRIQVNQTIELPIHLFARVETIWQMANDADCDDITVVNLRKLIEIVAKTYNFPLTSTILHLYISAFGQKTQRRLGSRGFDFFITVKVYEQNNYQPFGPPEGPFVSKYNPHDDEAIHPLMRSLVDQ